MEEKYRVLLVHGSPPRKMKTEETGASRCLNSRLHKGVAVVEKENVMGRLKEGQGYCNKVCLHRPLLQLPVAGDVSFLLGH